MLLYHLDNPGPEKKKNRKYDHIKIDKKIGVHYAIIITVIFGIAM